MSNRQTSPVRHAIAAGRTAARYVALEAITVGRSLRGLDRQIDDRPKVHVLLLHDVTNREIVPFRRLVSRLRQHYTFTDYSDAVTRITTGAMDRPYLSFTFDDGFWSCLAAAEVLEEFGTRGCFFVCPSVLNADESWRARFCRDQLWMRPTRFLNWSDVEQLLDRGHEIGSHTWDHFNMSKLGVPQLREQLDRSKAVLERRLGGIEHFAWPYGRFHAFSPEAARAVRAAGYLSCASGERGCHGVASGNALDGSADHLTLCIRRESIVARWPWRHVWYFLQQSARRPLVVGETWPAGWDLRGRSHRPAALTTRRPAEGIRDAA